MKHHRAPHRCLAGFLAALAEDIRKHGQREPVWLHRDGRIIDGRNRWLACERAGVVCKTVEYTGDDDHLVAVVLSLNLHRRHLSDSQRADVAAKATNLAWGGDRRSEAIKRQICPSITVADAAALLNVSEKSVKRARVVRDHGTPELKAAVEKGEIAVSKAAKLAREAPERQHEATGAT